MNDRNRRSPVSLTGYSPVTQTVSDFFFAQSFFRQYCRDGVNGFLVTKAVIPHVRARGGGSLIAITTTGVGMPGANAYWVSKAAAERLYLGLAQDLKPDNIAVNCLSPSRVVLTEGWQAGGMGVEIPPEMVEPPEAMGRAAVLLAGQDAGGVTGTVQRSEELTF